MKNLKVTRTYTTTNEESDDKGAISITCEVDGKIITVRTAVLKDENGAIIKEDVFAGKTIDVKGVVDTFSGEYQIRVFSMNSITIH